VVREIAMHEPTEGGTIPQDDAARYHKKDFWSKENLNFSEPHYRHEKTAQIVGRLAEGRACTLLDVGCGPAALMRPLPPNVQYYGIDIAIPDPAPNLREADFLETPISFGDRQFDFITALGFFEYVGDFQSQKFSEIAQLLKKDGKFIVSYWNFGHRKASVYWAFSNIQPVEEFRNGLAAYFDIDKCYPASHNWKHGWPGRKLNRAINRHVNMNIPFVSPVLAVEYFFICSRRDPRADRPLRTQG
jgi:SAM-dependent methyltransferase